MISGAPVYWYDEIDSTSEEAKRRAKSGDLSPVWIAARAQTLGRGRLGRTWQSPPGNLFATALFAEPGGHSHAARIPFAAGLAVRDACSSLVPGADLKLKWPNDVRVDGAKLSGILVESGIQNGTLWLAVGIGVNVQTAPDIADQATTSLVRLGAPAAIEPSHVLDALQSHFAARCEQARAGFASLLRDWESVAEGLGQSVTAGAEGSRITGLFEGLAEDGGMILRLPDRQTRIIRAGEVELVRQVSE